MNADTKAKLDKEPLPRKAVWTKNTGMTQTGKIIARGPDYIEVLTEQGIVYRQPDVELLTVRFV